MIKTRYIVAFVVLLTVVTSASFYSYNVNYKEELENNKDAISDLADAVQLQYDTLFLQICKDVENTIQLLNARGFDNNILIKGATDSVYITDYLLVKNDGSLLGGSKQEVTRTSVQSFFLEEGTAMCIGMVESQTVDNKYYAVNKIQNNETSYLLLVGLNYDQINNTVKPEVIDAFDSYPYLISNDGYMLYHPEKKILGLNVFKDKDLLKEISGLKEVDYQALVNALSKRNHQFYYRAYGIKKIAYNRSLNTFNGTVVLAADYTSMIKRQYIATLRTIVPLLMSLAIGVYIFLRYIFIMKYTDYFTEVKNNIAFRKHYETKNSGQDKMLVLKIDNVISKSGKFSFIDDTVFYKISDYFKSFKSAYLDLYRISRVHYVFVFSGTYDEGMKLFWKLKKDLLPGQEDSLFLSGKVLMLDLDAKGPILDIDSHILNHMDDYYMALNNKKNKIFYKYSGLLAKFNEKLLKKSVVESLIRNKQLEPFFQPIMDLKTKVPYKYEVLMRPTIDIQMKTEEIVIIAEEFGWVEDLDRSMIKQSFYYCNKVLIEKGIRLKISINLSCKSIHNGIVQYLMEMTKKCDLKAHDITVEITETAAFNNLDESIRNLKYLQKQGYLLAIDDFGTGYAHVELLSKLKVDYVKIDGIFVNNAEKNEQQIKTLNALVYLAKNYNAKVIAEYVESSHVIKLLDKLEVEYAQGFHFCKPLSVIELSQELS